MTPTSPTTPTVNRRFQAARAAYLAAHNQRAQLRPPYYGQQMGEWLTGYIRSLGKTSIWSDAELAETIRGISAALDDLDETESVESVDQLVALVAAVDAAGAQS